MIENLIPLVSKRQKLHENLHECIEALERYNRVKPGHFSEIFAKVTTGPREKQGDLHYGSKIEATLDCAVALQKEKATIDRETVIEKAKELGCLR